MKTDRASITPNSQKLSSLSLSNYDTPKYTQSYEYTKKVFYLYAIKYRLELIVLTETFIHSMIVLVHIHTVRPAGSIFHFYAVYMNAKAVSFFSCTWY